MPAVSKAESRYLNMKFGHDWVVKHGFDNTTKGLPEHVHKALTHKKRKRKRHAGALARAAAKRRS